MCWNWFAAKVSEVSPTASTQTETIIVCVFAGAVEKDRGHYERKTMWENSLLMLFCTVKDIVILGQHRTAVIPAICFTLLIVVWSVLSSAVTIPLTADQLLLAHKMPWRTVFYPQNIWALKYCLLEWKDILTALSPGCDDIGDWEHQFGI